MSKKQTPETEVTEEICCKNPFSVREGNIYYEEHLYSTTQGWTEEHLKNMVDSLNMAYYIGFSKYSSLMLR